jgi:Na+-transporting methylmalonyl-CoA/oxaloacetate decarboxylase gamma subunit
MSDSINPRGAFMTAADYVKTVAATLAVLGLLVVVVRLLGKVFWGSFTRRIERRKEILRRLGRGE